MNKKKRFNISESLQKGFEETIAIVENDEKIYRNTTIPIARITKDPENPRKVNLTLADISHGIDPKDPLYKEKQAEFQKIAELAESIKHSGLIQPIVVYKHIDKYCIIAGERRYLACLIAKKTEIEARVFQCQPNELELKLIQWFENNEREDLTLFERLGNIKAIYDVIPADQKPKKLTGSLLQEVTKLSKSQAAAYAAVLNGHQDVIEAVRNDGINSLDKALLITSCDDSLLRQMAIAHCRSGFSLARLRAFLNTASVKEKPAKSTAHQDKKHIDVNLGSTKKANVVKTIIYAVTSLPHYENHAKDFCDVDWTSNESITHAFYRLKSLLEQQG